MVTTLGPAARGAGRLHPMAQARLASASRRGIGRASGRGRGEISGGGVSLKKKKKKRKWGGVVEKTENNKRPGWKQEIEVKRHQMLARSSHKGTLGVSMVQMLRHRVRPMRAG